MHVYTRGEKILSMGLEILVKKSSRPTGKICFFIDKEIILS